MESYNEVTITLRLREPFTKEQLEKPIENAVKWFNEYNYEYVDNYSVDYELK